MIARSLLLLGTLLFGALALGGTVVAASLPDLRTIERETHKLAQLRQEIQETDTRSADRVRMLEDRLVREERSLTSAAVDAAALRGARLDVETIQSRLAVVEGRIEQHKLALARLRSRIDELGSALGRGDGLTAEDLRREAGLRLLREQEEQTVALLASFKGLADHGRRVAELQRQRLRLLQSRLRLSAIDRAAAEEDDQRVPVLEGVIADFMLRAARSGRDLEAVVGDTPSAEGRRRVLEGRVNDAVTRGFLRQNDLELVHTENRIDALASMLVDNTMPPHVLQAGERKLVVLERRLDQIEAALNSQARGLESRQAALARQGDETQAQLEAAADLKDLMTFQRQDIAKLRERLDAEQSAFARVIGEASTASILEHRPLPTAAADWQRILVATRDLPRMATDTLSDLARISRAAAVTASPGRLVLLALGAPLMLALTFWGARRLGAFARDETKSAPLALGAEAAARAMPAALPAGLWALAWVLLDLQREMALPVLLLLALWPTTVFLLRLPAAVLRTEPGALAEANPLDLDPVSEGAIKPDGSEGLPSPRGAEIEVSRTAPHAKNPQRATSRRRLYRHLRIGVVIGAGVAALHLLAMLLPLPPLLSDLLDRVGMLAFLALLPPAIGTARALRERMQAAPEGTPRALRFLSRFVRLLPWFVFATGVAGVLGYTNLAWTLVGYSLWLLLVALGIFLGVGLLRDLAGRVDDHLREADRESAAFWRSHFVEPGRRLAQLGLYLGGGYALLRLWGWDAESPIVRWVRGLAGTELFKIGAAPFTAGDILLTLILLGSALWVGGWSQQVSYRLAYRRVRGLGLRQALATFTQYVVIVAGVLLALSIIGFDLTALTVFAASLGVGIGFGLQNIVNNFISGVLLLAERPLRLGDFVSIGPHDGTVTQIGIRSLTVLTPDRQEVVIPNGDVISKEFTNWTRSNDTVRQVHYLLIRYDSDRERAMELIREVLAANPNVLSEPKPGIYLYEYTDQGVRIRVQFCFRFVHGPGGFVTRSEVLLEIGRRFEEHGIAFAEIGMLRGMAEHALAQPA